jgi:hypothetical protein
MRQILSQNRFPEPCKFHASDGNGYLVFSSVAIYLPGIVKLMRQPYWGHFLPAITYTGKLTCFLGSFISK